MQNLILINGMKELAELIREEVQRVIIEQGHKLTGKVYEDVDNVVKSLQDSYLLEGWYQDYSVYLYHGVKAGRIPYNPGSGAKHSLYIEAMIRYAKHRGMTNPKSAAFAIASTHKREGMPTKASSRFSKSGERLRFLDFALENERVDQKVSDILFQAVVSTFENALAGKVRVA